MTLLSTEAEIALGDPEGLAARLIDHLAEHEIAFERRGGSTVADLGKGTGVLTVQASALKVRIEAADRGDLEMFRSVFAAHIVEFGVEFAPEPLAIRWTGLQDGAPFAHFREIRLKAVADLTPHLRRLTFTGHDLARFASEADLHVRLFFPPPGLDQPEWPRPGPDGRIVWPPEERRPAQRYYTIRSIDPERGELAIDFVMHADAGPGAAFAASGRPGDRLGMVGPIGRTVGPASRHLLAGDETALPAIARILESFSDDARGAAFIEVAGPEEEIPLTAPPGIAVRWLHRNGLPAGTPDRLFPVLRESVLPAEDVFVWIGCEFALAKALRRHFEKERGLPRERCLIVGYWSRAEEPEDA